MIESRKRTTVAKLLAMSWLGLGASSAMAQLALPMENYPLNPGVKTGGYEVLQGVLVDVNERNMSLAVQSTDDLFYVPAFATTEMSDKSLSVGANCGAVEAELESERALAGTKLRLVRVLQNNEDLLEELIAESAAAAGRCIRDTASASSAAASVTGLQTRLVEQSGALRSKRTELQTCNLVTPGECTELAGEVTDLAVEVQETSNQLITAQDKETLANSQKARSCAEQTAAARQATELTTLVNDIRREVSNIEDDVIGTIDSYGTQLGGTAIAVVSSRARRQIEELESLNPNSRVRPLPIKEARFFLAPPAYGTGDNLIPRQTVLAIAVTGAEPKPTMNGETFKSVANSGGSVGVTVTLSRLGACSEDLTATAGFNIKYDTYSYLNGQAKWEKWSTYKKIEETKKSGGFFSSKTVHSLWEDMKAGDGFEFVLLNDNGGVDADTMRTQLQAALLDRVIKTFAEVKSLNAGGTMTMPTAGPHGAAVAADGLSKCPHVYCQGAVFALRTLDSIFGRDVSRQEVEQAWSAVTTDKFSYTQVYQRQRSISTELIIR